MRVLSQTLGNKKFLLVAIDYFIKRVEGKPLALIREVDVIRFIFRNILSRFDIPIEFVLDNGKQFVSQKVKDMLDELKIKFYNSMPSYP